MRWITIAYVIALPWFESQLLAIFQLDVERTAEAKKDVSLAAPVIGDVSGRVLDYADADLAEGLSSPKRNATITGMFRGNHLHPIRDHHGRGCHFHALSIPTRFVLFVASRQPWTVMPT